MKAKVWWNHNKLRALGLFNNPLVCCGVVKATVSIVEQLVPLLKPSNGNKQLFGYCTSPSGKKMKLTDLTNGKSCGDQLPDNQCRRLIRFCGRKKELEKACPKTCGLC